MVIWIVIGMAFNYSKSRKTQDVTFYMAGDMNIRNKIMYIKEINLSIVPIDRK